VTLAYFALVYFFTALVLEMYNLRFNFVNQKELAQRPNQFANFNNLYQANRYYDEYHATEQGVIQ
jgi:hypothetical protein